MANNWLALSVALIFVWLGMVLAISFLEAPLKFLAPGITIPLGLGIGRLVFTALNVAAGIVLVVLTLASLRPRPTRPPLVLLTSIWLVYLVEVVVIRPVLNRRSDLVIAGAQAPGTDWAHYAYIAADAALLVLLVALAADTVRRLLPATAAAPRQPVDA